SFDRVLGINLRGPYFLTQRVANVMIGQQEPEATTAQGAAGTSGEAAPSATTAQGAAGTSGEAAPSIRGTIVNVSSTSAVTVSTNRGEYCISKAGVGMA